MGDSSRIGIDTVLPERRETHLSTPGRICMHWDVWRGPQTALALREALLAIDIDWDNARATSWRDAHHVEQPAMEAAGGSAMGSSRFIRKEMG